MEPTSAWLIRPYNPATDENCLLDNWISSYRVSPWAGAIPNNKFFAIYGEAISELIARGSKVLVACNPEDPNQILGWVCTERTARGDIAVHFVYVKDTFRKFGISKDLLRAAGVNYRSRFYYTYRTKAARFYPLAAYEPAIARRHKA